MKQLSMKEVVNGYIGGLDSRINDYKLKMHDKCFDEIQEIMIHNVGSRSNSNSNKLKMLKSCCHHSVHTDGAW